MSAQLRVAPPPDVPCILTTSPEGQPDWCERHQERHPKGSRTHALSQDPGEAGVRFRRTRDKYSKDPALERSALVTASYQRRGVLVSPGRTIGPGGAVAEILKQRGITPRPGCGCNKIMAEMDATGVEGCRAKVDHFASQMRANKSFMSWEGQIAAVWTVAVAPTIKAAWNRLLGKAPPDERPFYSFSALILDACDVAERHQRADRPTQVGATAHDDAQTRLLQAAQQVSAVSPPRPWKAPIRWAVGLTAVPSRRRDLLPRTLASLASAGFEGEHAPRLFVDGAKGPWDEFPHDVTFRFPSFDRTMADGKVLHAPWGNWWLGMQELYLRQPDADRYVMFQDDVIAVKNLRQYLDASPFPSKGYLNLFAFMNNEMLVRPQAGSPGWIEAALMPPPSSLAEGSAARNKFLEQRLQCGRGALALVFDREGLVELLRFKDAVERPLEHPVGRGLSRIDGGVVDSMNKLGWREWTHRPSLVQHTGTESAATVHPHPNTGEPMPKHWRLSALTFPGENFDPMSLLPQALERKVE